MKTNIISLTDKGVEKIALDALKNGEVIALPTDTVYGIACLLNNENAISNLYTIKGRDSTKAIPVLIGEYEQLIYVAEELSVNAQKLAQKYWPGALTLVVTRNPHLPEVLSPFPTVGVRMPDHNWLQGLIIKCGPIAATSANISSAHNPSTAQDVLDQLADRIPLIINGGECKGGIPSTVVDCSRQKIKILREGKISKAEIFASL